MILSNTPKNCSGSAFQGGCACALNALAQDQKDKKSNCCKSFKHGKRCKKCPGKKK